LIKKSICLTRPEYDKVFTAKSHHEKEPSNVNKISLKHSLVKDTNTNYNNILKKKNSGYFFYALKEKRIIGGFRQYFMQVIDILLGLSININ